MSDDFLKNVSFILELQEVADWINENLHHPPVVNVFVGVKHVVVEME
jgi:pterin-4a-carbinolamine dehydratase